jgi:hypothetical protein
MIQGQRYVDLLRVIFRLLRSQVYFLREARDGPIKIGYAGNVVKRMLRLQQGNPSALRVYATLPGGRGEERALHRRFRHLRIRGEWYEASEDLLAYVAAHAELWSAYEQELSESAAREAVLVCRRAEGAGRDPSRICNGRSRKCYGVRRRGRRSGDRHRSRPAVDDVLLVRVRAVAAVEALAALLPAGADAFARLG